MRESIYGVSEFFFIIVLVELTARCANISTFRVLDVKSVGSKGLNNSMTEPPRL